MEEQATRTQPRRRGWAFGLVCFALGMAAMWGLQCVDVLSIFRTGAGTEEELARGVFEALRDEDYDSFDAYLPGEGDFDKLIARIREHGTDRDHKRLKGKIERDGGAAGAARKTRESSRSKFAKALERSRSSGLDWKNAEYIGLNRKTMRIAERYGWRGGDIRFLVQSNGENFEFKLDGCTCVDGSWLIGGGVFLMRRRGDQADPVTLPKATGEVSQPKLAPETTESVTVPEEPASEPGR